MKKNRKIINKTDDIIDAIGILLFDLGLAAFFFFFVVIPTIHHQFIPTIHHRCFFRICIMLVLLLTLFGEIHFFRWFVFDGKQNINCHNCGENVVAKRIEVYNPDNYLPVMILSNLYAFIATIRIQICRPILHYTCPKCGATEYICPYCHKIVHKEDEKCPYCGRRMIKNMRTY